MSIPVQEGNILVGAGKMEVGPYGGSYSAMGGTEDGVEFSMPKEFHDVEAAEANVVLRKESTKVTATVTTRLLEATLDNLLLSWPGAISGSTLTIGTDGIVPEMQFKFTGKAPAGDTREIEFLRVVSISPSAIRHTKGANAAFDVEFEVLAEWDNGTEQWIFGTMEDS